MRLVDTSSWIHSLRPNGDATVRARLTSLVQAGAVAWCPVVRLELWAGARGAVEKRIIKQMEQTIPELEIGAEVWEMACELSRKARAAGQTLPVPDLLIAACARHHGVGIEHADAHFDFLATL